MSDSQPEESQEAPRMVDNVGVHVLEIVGVSNGRQAWNSSLAGQRLELSDDEIEDSQTDALKPAATKEKSNDLSLRPRWPQFGSLLKDHAGIAKILLCAVDEVDAQHEVTAKNTPNIKGNKWAMLRFVTFGGDRGSLAGRLPPVAKATELKKKVMDIWKFLEANKEDDKINKDVLALGLRQYAQYKDHEKAVEEGKKSNERKNAELQARMDSYERGQGAIPPGAKATGAGRVNHSTNLKIAQPSSFGYVVQAEAAAEDTGATEVSEDPRVTPKPTRRTDAKSAGSGKSSGKSSLTNSTALADLNDFSATFKQLVDRIPGSQQEEKKKDSDSEAELDEEAKSKKRKCEKQRKRLKKKAQEYKEFSDSNPTAKRECDSRLKKISKIDKKIDALYGDDDISAATSLGSSRN